MSNAIFTPPETRGRPNKYDFSNMEVGVGRAFPEAKTRQTLMSSAKSYAEKRGLGWKFASRTIEGVLVLYRVA